MDQMHGIEAKKKEPCILTVGCRFFDMVTLAAEEWI
jgi:hypothetical protein